MIPYISLFTFSLLCACSSLLWKSLDKYISIVLFVVIGVIIGFRFESVDYYGYWSIYDSVASSGLSGFSKERGFALLMLIEQNLFGHFFCFIFLFSIISLRIKYKAFSNITPFLTLSLFIYICNSLFWKDLGQIRNGFIAGMMLIAVYYAYNRKLIRFLITILLASQIHLAAVLGLVIYFVSYIRNKNIMYILVTASFLLANLGGVGKILLNYIPEVGLGTISTRTYSYVGGEYDIRRNVLGISSLINLMMIYFIIYNYDKLILKNKYNFFLIPLAVIGITADYIFADFGIIGSRIFDMFYFPSIILILSVIYELPAPRQRWISFLGIFLYCAVSFGYSLYAANGPYLSIFSY